MSLREDYLKHKETLFQYGKFNAIAAGVSVCAMLLLFFLPCFRILGIFDFSLLDELIFLIEGLINGSVASTKMIMNIYSLVACAYVLVGVGMLFYEAIKTILKMRNPDDYTMQVYDKLVHRKEVKAKKNAYYGPWGFLYSAIVMLLVDIFVFKIAFNIESGDILNSSMSGISRMFFVDGISVWGIIAIIVMVAGVVLSIIASANLGKVKKAIIKAEYSERMATVKSEENDENK